MEPWEFNFRNKSSTTSVQRSAVKPMNQTTSCLAACNHPIAAIYLFNFSGQNITVPVSEFVRNDGWTGGMCQFYIYATTGSYILGDAFLRGAYVVYNLQANEIALAQTIFNTTNSSDVGNNSSYYTNFGIPNAVNASNIRTGIPTATGAFQPAVTNAASMKRFVSAATRAAAGLWFYIAVWA